MQEAVILSTIFHSLVIIITSITLQTKYKPHTYTMDNNTDYTKSRCGECLAGLQGMLKRQRTSYSCSSSSSSTDSEYMAVRRSLIDVFDEVFTVCQLQNRETVAVAVSYMDRFMMASTQRFVNTQLIAMTCFYLAVKLYEPTVIPPTILCELFQRILACEEEDDDEDIDDDSSTATVASAEAIESMELQLMQALKWNLNPPTAIMFVRQLLCCLPNGHLSQWKQTAASIAQKYLEMILKSEECMTFDASTQAVAALFCAVEQELPAAHRVAVYKFLLKAVHMTGPKEQRDVLAAQGVLRKISAQVVEEEHEIVTAVLEQPKRSAPVMTSIYIDRPAKKQRRLAVVELSPRSVYA